MKSFYRGFCAIVSPRLARTLSVLAIVGLLFSLMLTAAATGLDPFTAAWAGVLAFIALGGVLKLWSFIQGCIEAGASGDEPASLPDNVVKLPSRMSYTRIE